eukprot:scaffold39710_cov168-Amphora_coffeaeformis.AAC.1
MRIESISRAVALPLLAIVLLLALTLQQLQHFPHSSGGGEFQFMEDFVTNLLPTPPSNTTSAATAVAAAVTTSTTSSRVVENEHDKPNEEEVEENDDNGDGNEDEDGYDNDDDEEDDEVDDDNDEEDDEEEEDDGDDDHDDNDEGDDDDNDDKETTPKLFTQADTNLILHRVETSEQYLEAYSQPYYVYDDMALRKPTIRKEILKGICTPEYKQYLRDAIPEIEMLRALEKHSLRTNNTELAKQFIIPIPVGAVLIHKRKANSGRSEYPIVMNALLEQPLFQQTQGHKHVLISQVIPPFSAMRPHVHSMSIVGLAKFYTKLKNVTVAQEMDPQ